MLPSSSLTVPDVQLSRFRFFMEELCSNRCRWSRLARSTRDLLNVLATLSERQARLRLGEQLA